MTGIHKVRTIAALEKVIGEMQYLVDHPRMRQRNWVAAGKMWLPVLHQAKEDLALPDSHSATASAPLVNPAPIADESDIYLVRVYKGQSESYVNVRIKDITEVTIAQIGTPGHYVQLGAHNSFTLKNGTHYPTTLDEALRLIEAIKQQNTK